MLSQNAAVRPVRANVSSDRPVLPAAAGHAEMIARFVRWLDPTKQRALTALVIRVAGAGLAYVMQILLAQWMGRTEYGVFVTVWVWLLVLGGVAPLGLNVGVIGLVSRFHEAGDFNRWRGALVSSIVMTLCAGLLVAGLGWSTLYLSPGLLDAQYLLPAWLCLFCVPLMALSEINEGIARAHGWMNTALAPTYLLRPVLLIAGAFGLVQSGSTLTATLSMSIAILACFLTILVQSIVMLARLWRINPGKGISASPMTWLLASLPIVITQTFELITQNFDMIAVSYFLGPESTAVYFAALKTIALLAFVNFAIGAATANRLAGFHAEGQRKELEEQLSTAVNLAFWPTLLGAVTIVLLAPLLLSFFGKGFADHSYLIAVLAVGFVAKSFVGPAELYLSVLGQQKICALVLLMAASLNMALNIILIPLFGLLGAAVATSASLVVLAACLFVTARWRIGVWLRPRLPISLLCSFARRPIS
jgi:O-antigen/teichoic acid export membrane protein